MSPPYYAKALKFITVGDVYTADAPTYIIEEDNTIEDILRHLLNDVQGDREELVAILRTMEV
jgi:hypothetical protein